MPDSYRQSSGPTRLCVLRLSAIGDTCHALSVVRRLQDNWPDAALTWIIGKTEATLMQGIDGVEFIIFDKSRSHAARRDIGRQLRARRFDVALCMHASLRANLLCRHIRAEEKIGFDRKRARDFQWLFTDHRIEHRPQQHALDAMMSFATAIGAAATPLRWDIPLDDDARAFAAALRQTSAPLVVISPCSSQRARNYRNWPVERFAAVVEHLDRRGCRIVITGGPSAIEAEYGRALAAGGKATNLVGKTRLKQLLAVLAAADLVICPDSGPAHMATAVQTPVLGLYATSNPGRTGPYRSRELCIDRYPDAVRRYLGKSADAVRWGRRVRHPDAMNLITIDDVVGKIDEFMSSWREFSGAPRAAE